MDETMTRALLARVLAAAPPPAEVDLDRVIGLAEAERRRHTRLVIAVAAALVLVVTFTVAALVPRLTTDDSAPPASKVPPGTTPSAAAGRFDPLHASLELNGLPAGMTVEGTSFGSSALHIYAMGADRAAIYVAVGAKGVPLADWRSYAKSKVVAGPPIRGHSSRWYSGGGIPTSQHVLRWQWATGADASLVVDNTRGDPLQLATRIARNLTIDVKSPTRLPITLRTPAGFQLQEFQSDTRPGLSPGAALAFGGPGKSFISVNANLLGKGIGPTNMTYQGRRARVTVEPSGNGNGGTYITMVLASGDLKITGTCDYNLKNALSLADFKTLCLATTGSAKRVADLTKPATWPRYVPQ